MRHEAARIVGLYRRHGTTWEALRRRSPVMEAAWLARFRAALPRRVRGPRVLDLGCGGGWPVAAMLAAAGCRVTGLDTAPALLALARARLPRHRWLRRDMRGALPRHRFDGILAWDSAFHLAQAEQRRLIRRLAAVAAPGAAVMLTSGPRHGEAIGRLGGEPLFHASLSPGAYRRLLAAAGFRVLAHAAEDPLCGGRTVWLAHARGRWRDRRRYPMSG
ncbi:MAG: class I SAM-dependent methyltransferase [Acetobacteraceae bacterium]|jgi:SAM-dependent methyltransferase|nr:class I SAM-dependent methyltransferase [Acetobacteraceae bacterium]